jgi:hypothetical protein
VRTVAISQRTATEALGRIARIERLYVRRRHPRNESEWLNCLLGILLMRPHRSKGVDVHFTESS